MKAIEIKENRIIVKCNDGNTTAVARYEDKNGVYFLNEMLQKQYANIIPNPRKEVICKISSKKENALTPFKFHVEYGWGETSRRIWVTINAIDKETACAKLEKRYKNLLEYSEA